jgi:glutathione S-transferase
VIRIYHAPRTRSIRVIWLCEELGIPHEVVPIDFSPAYRASPEYRRLNPVGKVPAISIGDFTMFESAAIVEYLLELHGNGRLRPAPGTEQSAAYLQWGWFAEATFARPLGDIAQHTRIKPPEQRIPAVVEDARARALLCLDALEPHLQRSAYLVGDDFTAADIIMGYTLLLARWGEVLTGSNYPTVNAYLDRLMQRPALVKALA